MGYPEIHVMGVVLADYTCDPCTDFPKCRHTHWEAECPECGASAKSVAMHGPYVCGDCDLEFMVAVEGWVCSEGVGLDGWDREEEA